MAGLIRVGLGGQEKISENLGSFCSSESLRPLGGGLREVSALVVIK